MSTFKANAILLTKVLDDVKDGQIQLPDFQRGWVWDDDRIKDLLVSISRGFPIGAVMTLAASGEVRFQSRLIEGVTSNGDRKPAFFLLDGQQRLTSLYQALRYTGPVETRSRPGGKREDKKWYYIDIQKALDPLVDRDDTIVSVPEDRVVRSNIGRDVDLDLSSCHREFANHMMPTEEVMKRMGWGWGVKYIKYWQNGDRDHPSGDPFDFFSQLSDGVLKEFNEYQLPVIELGGETSKEAVCTVFEKVNTGGVTLGVFELVTASFAAGDFRLRDDWDERKKNLHSDFGVLQGVGGDQFLQAVTLLATQKRHRQAVSSNAPPNRTRGIGCSRADILNLKLSEYEEWANQVEAGFRDAAKFLHSQFVFTRNNVPYNTQLVPLAALHVELGEKLAAANARDKLTRWFWCGIFDEAYGSAVETQFARDLAQVANYVRGGPDPELVTQANFAPERLLSLRTRNSAAYKGLYALQMKRGAADWRTGESLTLANWNDENIDIHHIFPVAWCSSADQKISPDLYQSIINKTPIDASTNRRIGGQAPSRYLPRLREDNEGLNCTLEKHWIDPALLEGDLFRDFFVKRGQTILEKINGAMGKQTTTDGRQALSAALDAAGLGEQYGDDEDDEVEYDPVGDSAYVEEGLADAAS